MKLKSYSKLTVDDMQKLQQDDLDVSARELAPRLVKVIKAHMAEFVKPGTEEHDALEYMAGRIGEKEWNYKFSEEGDSPMIFATFYGELQDRMLRKLLSDPDEHDAAIHSSFSDHYMAGMIDDWSKGKSLSSEECANEFNAKAEHNCVHNVIFSLLRAHEILVERLGENRNSWKWLRGNVLAYPHFPFSESRWLRWLFHRETPSSAIFTMIISHREARTRCQWPEADTQRGAANIPPGRRSA